MLYNFHPPKLPAPPQRPGREAHALHHDAEELLRIDVQNLHGRLAHSVGFLELKKAVEKKESS